MATSPFDADDMNRVHLYYPGIFARIIADEAQKLKSIATVAHRSVSDLGARHHVLLTATSMINRPIDLIGLLALFWKEDWEATSPTVPAPKNYVDAKSRLVDRTLFTDDIDGRLWLLNPTTYKQWATPDARGFLPASDAHEFIPSILCLIQLKRTSATEIESVPTKGSYRIGAEIPAVRWLTIELQMMNRELAQYHSVITACTGNLAAGFDVQSNTGIRNIYYHRRLYLAVLFPELDHREQVKREGEGD